MTTRLDARWIGLAVAALAAAGCGGGKDALERQMDGLRAELAKVRADNAVLEERLIALERTGRRKDAEPAAPTGARTADAPDRPELEVVRLTPDAGAASFDAGSDADAASAPASASAPARVSASVPTSTPVSEPASAAAEPRPMLRSTRGGEVIVAPPPLSSSPRRTP